MIKMMSALRRLPGLSRREFSDYWREVHGPLIVALSPDLGVIKYVQSHAAAADIGKMAASCDGVAEVWFDSYEAQMRRSTDPKLRAAIKRVRADEDNFIDRDQTIVWWGHDTLLLPVHRSAEIG